MNPEACKIPVFSDTRGEPSVLLFKEDQDDGFFRRNAGDPFRGVRQYIIGVSESFATLTTKRFDHAEREWTTPTVLLDNGRTQSFYQFMRDGIKNRVIHVTTTTSENGKVAKLRIHKLELKATASIHVRALVARQFAEALGINRLVAA